MMLTTGDFGYGIYVDDISAGQEIYSNIFFNVGDATGDFLMYTNGIFAGVDENGTVLSDSYWYSRVVNGLAAKPEEGEEGYELWKERWPILYRYNLDISKEGELDCSYTMVNYIKNNAIIGSEFTEPERNPESNSAAERYGVFEGNKNYSIDENPFFNDPTHGDYSFKDGVSFGNIDFTKIGLKY